MSTLNFLLSITYSHGRLLVDNPNHTESDRWDICQDARGDTSETQSVQPSALCRPAGAWSLKSL